jgi:hypothetical protein
LSLSWAKWTESISPSSLPPISLRSMLILSKTTEHEVVIKIRPAFLELRHSYRQTDIATSMCVPQSCERAWTCSSTNRFKTIGPEPRNGVPVHCIFLAVEPPDSGRPKRRQEQNIKVDLIETGRKSLDWIRVAHIRDKWRVFVNMVMNFRVPYKRQHFLSTRETIRFLSGTLLHEVSRLVTQFVSNLPGYSQSVSLVS